MLKISLYDYKHPFFLQFCKLSLYVFWLSCSMKIQNYYMFVYELKLSTFEIFVSSNVLFPLKSTLFQYNYTIFLLCFMFAWLSSPRIFICFYKQMKHEQYGILNLIPIVIIQIWTVIFATQYILCLQCHFLFLSHLPIKLLNYLSRLQSAFVTSQERNNHCLAHVIPSPNTYLSYCTHHTGF